jgi:hypothetical protein
MLLAGNVAAVTQRMHYAAIYLQRSGYRSKMAAATSQSSVGEMLGTIHYASLRLLGLPNPEFLEQ